MRRWQLDDKKPIVCSLAADVRLSETDYVDDQSWQLLLGRGDDSTLTFQTHYGGRIGLASVVPIWTHENRIIYQANAYHRAPIITAFAPGFIRAEAELLPEIDIVAEYWIADSHSVSGQFTINNTGNTTISLRLDLYGHAVQRTKELQISILTLKDETNALYFGKLNNIDPVVLVESGSIGVDAAGHVSARVGHSVEIPANGQRTIRWSHAAVAEMANSVRLARYWLNQDWQQTLTQINQLANTIPQITTENPDWDATIAFAYQQMMQSMVGATSSLPAASFVTSREPITGYSKNATGTDHIRDWSGQNPTIAYLIAPVIASIDPELAEGIIKNYVKVQHGDGWIDWSPGLGGQTRDLLILPILARLVWNVFEVTNNTEFLKSTLPALIKYFERWFYADVDADGDGLPEWQQITQTGYAGWQLFRRGVDISFTETPDLAAYLLSEAITLQKIAEETGEVSIVTRMTTRIEELKSILDDMWRNNHFVYRDRDTHTTPSGATIIEKGIADEEHIPALKLIDASRIVIEVVGGTNHKPRMSVELQGLDSEGLNVKETIEAEAFTWTYGSGTVMSQTVFSQIDRITPKGLSRVYRINAHATDLDDLDINTVLPIWTEAISPEKAQALVAHIMSTLLKPNGLVLYPTPDTPGADESGIWIYWNHLICEGLFAYGFKQEAVDILKRLLRVQTATLREKGLFTTFYHEEDMVGVGERASLGGIVPLSLLMKAFGIIVRADGTVQVDHDFPWHTPIKIEQHGISIERTPEQTVITQPDGQITTVPHGVQKVVNPTTPIIIKKEPLNLPEKPPLVSTEPSVVPVRIEVDTNEEE